MELFSIGKQGGPIMKHETPEKSEADVTIAESASRWVKPLLINLSDTSIEGKPTIRASEGFLPPPNSTLPPYFYGPS